MDCKIEKASRVLNGDSDLYNEYDVRAIVEHACDNATMVSYDGLFTHSNVIDDSLLLSILADNI